MQCTFSFVELIQLNVFPWTTHRMSPIMGGTIMTMADHTPVSLWGCVNLTVFGIYSYHLQMTIQTRPIIFPMHFSFIGKIWRWTDLSHICLCFPLLINLQHVPIIDFFQGNNLFGVIVLSFSIVHPMDFQLAVCIFQKLLPLLFFWCGILSNDQHPVQTYCVGT